MRIFVCLFTLGFLSCTACAQNGPGCPPETGVALQVLGSGGPIADDGRSSAAYIVWVDGQSRVMIDAGSGSFLRFGEAGASFAALDFIGLSHFHTDHSAAFPALLKSGWFSDRDRPLTVAGPDGAPRFPGLGQYLDSMLSPETGAYAYLAGYLDGSDGLQQLEAIEVSGDEIVTVLEKDSLRIEALHVPHGIVPALGFRVIAGETVFVFASDQNGSDEAFIDFARDADILVMHMVVPENAAGRSLQLHAKPSRLGEIADEAGADTLVLSHFMARSLRNVEANIAAVTARFDGRLVAAEDLMCVSAGPG